MHRTAKKLRLSRDLVRPLQATSLADVAGGRPLTFLTWCPTEKCPTRGEDCPTVACPTMPR